LITGSRDTGTYSILLGIRNTTDFQPFLAARHGALLNEDGSSVEALERKDGLFGREEGSLSETKVGFLRTDDGLLEIEDESLVETEVGLFETEDDSSFGTEDGCLFGTAGEGLLETKDEGLFEGVDGLFTRDDGPSVEAEEEHCMVESAGFLDRVGVAGLEEGVVTFKAGLGQA
jgi:hypothetical protein